MSTGLSPNDIRNYEFPNQMRGFDKDEVRGLLEQIAVTIEKLGEENLKVSMERDNLRSQLESVKQFEESIKNAAIDARRNADTLVSGAKKQVQDILDKAKQEANEMVIARREEAEKLEQQIAKLGMIRSSYQTKLRNLIESHQEMVDKIEMIETPSLPESPEPVTTETVTTDPTPEPEPSSTEPVSIDTDQDRAETAPQPTSESTPAPQITESPKTDSTLTQEPTQSSKAPVSEHVQSFHEHQRQTDDLRTPEESKQPTPPPKSDTDNPWDFSNLMAPEKPETLNTTNGIEVEESTEVTRSKRETFSSEPEKEEREQMEEANAPSKIIPAEGQNGGIDPELAEALKSYQADQVNEPTSRPTSNEERDDSVRTNDPIDDSDDVQEQSDTDKIRTETADENTEHNTIDIDSPVGEDKPQQPSPPPQPTAGQAQPSQQPQQPTRQGTTPTESAEKKPASKSPEDLARELDEVAAKFEEEMDKAAKS